MHCVSYLDYRKGQQYLSNLFTHGYVLTTLRIFYNMLKSHIRISYGIHHMVIFLFNSIIWYPDITRKIIAISVFYVFFDTDMRKFLMDLLCKVNRCII